MTDTSGQNSCESSQPFGLAGLLAKMLRESSIWNSTIFSMIWKHRTTKRKRLLYRLAPSKRPTAGNGCGLLPTPCASDATTGSILPRNGQYSVTGNGTLRQHKRSGQHYSLNLGRLLIFKTGLDLLPTPTASNAVKNQKIRKPSPSDPNGRTLSERLGLLPTPKAIDSRFNIQTRKGQGRTGGASLPEAIAMLATPTASQAGKPIGTEPIAEERDAWERYSRQHRGITTQLDRQESESTISRMDDGIPEGLDGSIPAAGIDGTIPNIVDRNKSLGNAIVPQVVYPILRLIAIMENAHGNPR